MNASVRRITRAAAFGLLVLGSCSNQSEGDRCDQKNGDGDCAEGLICKQVSGRADTSYCCPPDESLATVPQCGTAHVFEAGTYEAATPDVGVPDAASEAEPDAPPPDVSSEAALDAPPPDVSSEAAPDAAPEADIDAADDAADATD